MSIAEAESVAIAQHAIRNLLAKQSYREAQAKVREQRRQMDALSDRLWAKLKEHNKSSAADR
jgi:hypothetical protein